VVVGFGIDNHKQAKALSKVSDGCVIGSAIIKIIESNKEQNKFKISKKIEDFLIKFSREK
jgi:tryptophan synthase alpha subunit